MYETETLPEHSLQTYLSALMFNLSLKSHFKGCGSVDSIKSAFLALERDAEIGNLDANGWRNWQDLKINFLKEQRNVTKDLKQKSRVKLVAEGDENTISMP